MSMNTSDKPAPKPRRKLNPERNLSITSLLDVLTIILVFLIKNVSTEAVKVSAEAGINYPSTITNDEMLEQAGVTPIKIFPDRVVVGTDALDFGTPADLMNNAEKRTQISDYLKLEAKDIYSSESTEACLIVQADNSIPCAYITEVVRIGTNAGYTYIYFATLEDADWLKKYNVSSTQ